MLIKNLQTIAFLVFTAIQVQAQDYALQQLEHSLVITNGLKLNLMIANYKLL